MFPAVEAQNLNHWTNRGVLHFSNTALLSILSIFRISEQDAKAKLKCNCDSLITNLDVGFYFFLIYGKYFPVCKRKDRATENG